MGLSIYGHTQNVYMLQEVQKSCFIDLFVCNLIIYIDLCQGENKINLILDINDQIITYVFASKGTQVVYLNLSFQ